MRDTSHDSMPVKRLTAVILILVLLAPPLMIVTDFGLASAQMRKNQSGKANTAPAPQYDFSSKTPGIAQRISESVSESVESITGYFSAPELPKGFEKAETVSPFYKDLSEGISFLSPSTTTKAATNADGDIRHDFDGDGKADVSRMNSDSTEWKIETSDGTGDLVVSIGTSGALPVPGDFDGDDTTDIASFKAGHGR